MISPLLLRTHFEATQLIDASEIVNDGVSLITFFGHSAPSSTDIDIGRVSEPRYNYRNTGRYPVMLVNGCNAGKFYLHSETSFGEDWVISKELGAIGFMAHSYFGISNLLKGYSDLFYEVAFRNPVFFLELQ